MRSNDLITSMYVYKRGPAYVCICLRMETRKKEISNRISNRKSLELYNKFRYNNDLCVYVYKIFHFYYIYDITVNYCQYLRYYCQFKILLLICNVVFKCFFLFLLIYPFLLHKSSSLLTDKQ